MKVRCIKDAHWDDTDERTFTQGREYTVINPKGVSYCVKNDLGDKHYLGMPKVDWFDEHFKVVK